MSSATAHHGLATDWPRMMLRRVDPARNMSRFWSARLQPSLFEEVLLVRNWGRIGSRGQERSYWFSTRQAALAAFNKLTAAKCRRGYIAADAVPEAVTHRTAQVHDWARRATRGNNAQL